MAAVESLGTGGQELCLLCIVPLLVLGWLGVSGGAAWLSVGCRLRHTAGRGWSLQGGGAAAGTVMTRSLQRASKELIVD